MARERVQPGDVFLCYLVKLSRWSGVLKVDSAPFEDATPIFADSNDQFTIRFKVTPEIVLDFEHSVPIQEPELWNALSFTRELTVGSPGWAYRAKIRQSLIQITQEDAEILLAVLRRQQQTRTIYELDSSDRRHIAQRTTVRTEQGEHEIEIPDRQEPPPSPPSPNDVRVSIQVQAQVAQIGVTLGFTIWIPPGDRTRVLEALPIAFRDKLVTTLPLNYDLATLKTIENIDVIWLDRRSIARAFEIEHTTAIYSGLLRMADLLAMQPRMNISLHIVAPAERRDQVRREIVRPVFSVLEGGAMASRCSFLSYEAVSELLTQPNLEHMRESILEQYEEFFDAY